MLPPWFRVAIGLEESAALIRACEPQVIPGLLQTSGYARAITLAGFPGAAREEIDRRVALRLARQEPLTRPDAPGTGSCCTRPCCAALCAVPTSCEPQYAQLIEAAAQPNITIQVIPFAAGWHPALHGMFNIFRSPGQQLPDIVYTESLTNASYLDKPAETALYTEALDRMCVQAASPERTLTILRTILKET